MNVDVILVILSDLVALQIAFRNLDRVINEAI